MGELLSVDCIFLSKSNCVTFTSQIDIKIYDLIFKGTMQDGFKSLIFTLVLLIQGQDLISKQKGKKNI